jgi:aspartyl-tRNA(Asn)/glutamyl-tRNA(Gln) amidotransferase subunit C
MVKLLLKRKLSKKYIFSSAGHQYLEEGAMIRKEEIEHLGWLARILLSEAEKELFEQQLSSILDYFAVLDEPEVTDVEPTYHLIGLKDVVRKDEPKEALRQEEVLRNAPRKEKGYFKSPRIL